MSLKAIVDVAMSRGVAFPDHNGRACSLTRHAVERLLERGEVKGWDDVGKVAATAAKAFAKASKYKVAVGDKLKCSDNGWEFRLCPGTGAIVTIIRLR